MADAQTLREEGNELFKGGKYEEALILYTQALEITSIKDGDKIAIYKNRAACQLKLCRYTEATADATKALEISPNDPKALFRRSQAFEKLGKIEEAYKDAVHLMRVEPKNTAIKPVLNRLGPIIQDKIKEQNSTDSKVSQMFNLAFDSSAQDREKRLQAANNLIVLAKEEAGAVKIVAENGISKLLGMAMEKDSDIVKSAVRVLACLAEKNKPRSVSILAQVGLRNLCALIGQVNEMVSTAATTLLQNIMSAVSGLHIYTDNVTKWKEQKEKGGRQPHPRLNIDEEAQKTVDEIFHALIKMTIHVKVSGCGRDSAMELIIKNVTRGDALAWTKKFLDSDGISNLLTVASTPKVNGTIAITDKSRMHASVALHKVWDDTQNDKERETYKEHCRNFLQELFADSSMDSQVEAIETISALLQGPNDVGQMMLSTSGVMEIIMCLAKSGSIAYQKVAVEAIVYSATKKEKCSGWLKDAVPVLKDLYQSTTDDHIKVRALVGLCKLGSFGGTDASTKPMAEGSTLALSKTCRRLLNNVDKDVDLRKWATEGLAYLTLDADIKEELIEDVDALRSLIELSKGHDKMILYASITVFVNLTNSYDKQDVEPELIELAKFAKQHVPEEHPKDSMEYIKVRIQKLSKVGVVNALVSLSSTDSKNSRELIARIFVALATEDNLRGVIVQGGGAKALIPLALDNNTDNGKVLAAHALAKVAVTMNPEIAFPGQRMLEIARPLLQLLHPDRTGLQNFEALLALTNLSSVSDSVRRRIVSEKGFSLVENYMFEDHDQIKRAATECMCNMVMIEEVARLYQGENDRVKLFVLFCQEDDPLLVRAAAGSLAILSADLEICKKIVEVKTWLESLQAVTVSEQADIQHRGCHILMNLIESSEEIAKKVVESNLLEIMMAVSKLDNPEKQQARKCVNSALETAVRLKIIQTRD